MDVLKTARHRAGMHVAVFNWLLPLAYAATMMLLVALFIACLGWNTERSLMVLDGLVVMMLLAPGIAYFVACKNPKHVHKQLAEMIRCEVMVLPMYAVALARSAHALQDLLQNRRMQYEVLWSEYVRREKVEFQDKLEKLRKMEKGASSKEKLLYQETFLLHHQILRIFETALGRMESMESTGLPEDVYQKICKATENNYQGFKKTLETNKNLWEGKIVESKRIISDATKCLQEV